MVLSIVSVIILTSIVVYSADAAGIPKKAISTVARFLESDLPTTTVFTDQAATLTGNPITINNLALGGNLNVGSNALTNSGHQITIPLNTGTVLLNNGSGSSLTGIVTSIAGTANNLTASSSTGAVTLNLGSNVVTTGASAQTISKPVKITGFSSAETGNKTSAYTVTSSDDVVFVDDSGGSVTITLPSAVGLDGKTFTIKKVSSSLNTVTISAASGQTIDGASSVTLNSAQEKTTIQSNNHYWFTLSPKGDDMDSYRIRGSTAGRYFSSGIDQYTDVIGATPTATTLNAYPFIVSKTIKIDQIGLSVSTLVAGSSCHAGIYTDTGNTAPSTLVTGSDVTLTTTSAGLKTGTVSITLQGNNLYWLAYECSTAATLKLVTIPVTSVPNVLGIVPTGAAVSVGTGYSATNTFGALPSTYPSAGLAVLTTAPVEIVVRIAS